MTTMRERFRSARNEALRLTAQQGHNLDEERKQKGADIRKLVHAGIKLVNESVPVVARSRQITDNPVIGTFDGVNTSFTLSFPVSGNEITVMYGNAAAITFSQLTLGKSNPPPAGGVYFDATVDKQAIVVNPAPQVADALMAVYNTER